MINPSVAVAAMALLSAVVMQDAPEPFRPFTIRAYSLVNGVAFDGNDDTMFFALLNREVKAHRGRPDSTAPETGIYSSHRTPEGWSEPALLPFSGPEFGEGDPQLARNGSYLIFTRWDHRAGWQQTCDLWISFRGTVGWTEPVPLVELNTPQPDYAAAISPDGRWLYYRAGGRYQRRLLAPIIAAAIERTT